MDMDIWDFGKAIHIGLSTMAVGDFVWNSTLHSGGIH